MLLWTGTGREFSDPDDKMIEMVVRGLLQESENPFAVLAESVDDTSFVQAIVSKGETFLAEHHSGNSVPEHSADGVPAEAVIRLFCKCQRDGISSITTESWQAIMGPYSAPAECGKCGESIWQLESVSPTGKSVTWKCEYCDKTETIRRDIPSEELSEREREPIPKAVQREVWRRDQGRCVECGSKGNLEFDHIIPFAKGGANTVRNLQLLCQDCNRRKSDRAPGHY